MKAAVYLRYGQPNVLHIKNIECPVPGDHEILVRIFSTAVNSGDIRLRKADPFAVRFLIGLTRPKINILGGVFSGCVVATGKHVTRFRIGDEVFGSTDMTFGAYAEYRCFSENGTLSIKPGNVSHSEAAVIPFGGVTALYFLKKVNIKPGQKVLIYGASGAVGTAAVQLAKYFGAEVTGICGTKNIELVKSLGADYVIDYTKDNFQTTAGNYDIIYDTVNKMSLSGGMKKLNKQGTLILGAAMMKEMIYGAMLATLCRKKVMFGIIRQTADDITFLGDLVQNGNLKPIIDRTYSLEQISSAHEYADKGHKSGNIAINL